MLSLCPHSLPLSAVIPLARGAVELVRSYSLEEKIQIVLQRKSCFVGKAHGPPFHVTGGMRQIEGVSVWGLKPQALNIAALPTPWVTMPSVHLESSRRCFEPCSPPLLPWILAPTLSFSLWPQSFGFWLIKGRYVVQRGEKMLQPLVFQA